MESHTLVAEAPPEITTPQVEESTNPVEAIPDVPANDQLSFADALETALGNLDAGEPTETVESIPVAEEPVSEEPVAEEPVSEEPVSEPTDQEPLDSLSEDIGDKWTPKAASRFKQLKSELKNNQSEVEQLRHTVTEQEAKLKEMSGLVENRDIDQLQERVSGYEFDKVLNNLEDTDAYKQAVSQPLGNLINQSNEIADKYEVDPDTLVDILALEDTEKQDEALAKVFPDASDRDKAKIYNIIDGLSPILERRQHLMANAEGALQEAHALEDQRRNQDAAEQAHLRANVTRNVATRVSEKLPFLSGVEGLDMGEIRDIVSEINPSTLHPVDFAYNAVAARLLPVLVREYLGARKEAEGLTDQLSNYEEAEPTMSGIPVADGIRRSSSDIGFADAIEAALGG
tara:strand:- start:64 stop:1266 length:1203 start_codon:yes stop_codon:yes gene_type:complete